MQNASIKMSSSIRGNYRNYILPNKVLINPYTDPKFNYEDLKVEQHKAQHLKQDIEHKQFDVGWHKLFDDASLAYDCIRPYFLDISKLDLSNSQITENGIGALTRSSFSVGLERIDFSQNPLNVTDLTLRYLADSTNLSNLQIVILTDTSISDIGMMYMFQPYSQEVELLSSGEEFRQTRRTFAKKVVEASLVVSRGLKTTYEFESTRMGDESFEASRREATQEDIPGTVRGAYQKLPMLSTLVLAGNQEISNQTLKYLSYSNSITKLKSLDLRWTRISDDGLIEFMSTSNCSNLQLLDVSYQHEKVTSAFLSAFALSQYCKKLTVLLCRNCDISDVGIADMIESDNTLNIEELDFGTFDDGKRKQRLSSRKKTTSKVQIAQMTQSSGLTQEEADQHGVTDKGLRKIGNAKFLGALKRFSLMGQQISEQAVIDFLQSDTFRTLQELNISNNIRMSDAVLSKIIESDKAKDLQKIIVADTAVSEQGIQTFRIMRKTVEIIHSIQFTSEIRKIAKLNREGIAVYLCDDESCTSLIDPSRCYKCPQIKEKKNKITSKEFPVKLCEPCGEQFKERKERDQIKRKCLNCQTTIARYKQFFQLFNCYLCSIGENRYKCAKCHKPYFDFNEENQKF